MNQVNISLLPREIRGRQRARRRAVYYLLVLSVTMLFILGIYLTLLGITLQARAEVNALRNEQAALREQVAAYQEYTTLQEQVKGTTTALGNAMGTTPDWACLLTDLSLHLPQGVWLNSLSASYQNSSDTSKRGSGDLILRGWVASQAVVDGRLDEIGAVPGFANVGCRLLTVENARLGLEVTARILPGEPYQPVIRGGVQ